MLLKLLALPLSAPIAGIRFCLDQVVTAAEQELLDDEPVREALLLLNLRLDEGEISAEEFAQEEAVLLRRLREIRAYKEQQAREQLGAEQPEQPRVLSMDQGAFVVEVQDELGPPSAPASAGPE